MPLLKPVDKVRKAEGRTDNYAPNPNELREARSPRKTTMKHDPFTPKSKTDFKKPPIAHNAIHPPRRITRRLEAGRRKGT